MTNKHSRRNLSSYEYAICRAAHVKACKGIPLSEKHKLKVSRSLKRYHPWKGRKHTDETKAKMKVSKRNSSYVPSKEKSKKHSIRMTGENNSRAKRVLIKYKGIEMCYFCLKYFHYETEINYSTLRKIAQRESYSKILDLSIRYLNKEKI